MNALPEVITFLVLQTLSADCAVCKIGNDVRFSNPVLSEWSLHTDSPTHCTEIKLGGVTVHSKSPEIPEQPLMVQLGKVHFSSDNGYICQTLKQMRTGFLSSNSTSNFNEFIQSTIKPTHKEASSVIISSSSLTFTPSMPTKHSSLTMPSTKSSFSSKGSTNSPSLTSLFSSESSTTSSFSTSSLSQDATSDATYTSSNLVPSTVSTPKNNPVTSSTGLLSSNSISNFNEFIQSTIKPTHKEASSVIISSSSLTFTPSMPTKHSSPTVPSTKSSFSSKGSTNSPSLTSLFSSESSTTSTFSTSSSSQDATSDATYTSSNLVPSTVSTPTNNPVTSSTAEATDGSSPTVAPCPNRFEATGEGVSCYQLIYDQLIFTNASHYCKDILPNAHLVTFENQAEEEWVVHVINNMTNTSGQDYWIGLKNAVYTWEDGSYLSYANFGDKYTDNGGECLFTDVSKDSTWKGGKCTDKKEILCEYEAPENTSSCSMIYDNSCYEIQTTDERALASQICEDIDKYVVQIETADEQVYLNNVLSKDFWIGLLKNGSATYVWEAKNNTTAEYFNFGGGNDVIPLPYGGICHRMKQDDSYLWNEDRCDTEHSFICEWSLD